MEQNQEENQEIRFEEYIESKEIYDGQNILNFLAKAKNISIKGGYHTIKINAHVEHLDIEGGFKELHIKAPIDKLTIHGGKSNIYVHNCEDAKVDKFYMMGGNHLVEILSYVHDLEIHGGVNIIKCNYINSKIDKITTIGGTRDIYLNPETDKCEKISDSGTCNFHKTEVEDEPIEIQQFLEEGSIAPTILTNPKSDVTCVICLQNYNEDREVYFLPCTHYFHKKCLKPYFQGKIERFCPECKTQVRHNLVD
jgi:hypothetical protein